MGILSAHLIMLTTNQRIEVFIDCVMSALDPGLGTLKNNKFKSSKLFSALKTSGQRTDVIKSDQFPILDLLPKAIQTASSGSPCVNWKGAVTLPLEPSDIKAIVCSNGVVSPVAPS